MKQLKNFLIKREQSQACLSFAKREKSRLLAKTILTLVALLAVTTGAWADGVTMKEITSSDIQSSWKGNTDPVKATDLPGFKAMTHDEAVALGAPSNNEKVYLIYAINASNKFAALIYDSGTKSSNETEFNLNILQSTAQNYWVYYTYSDAPAPSSSGPEVAWNKTSKTGTFTMPGDNVFVVPEYYPQAALTAQPTAINDVPATTDGAIVSAGTVANIGSTTTAQGTVMYYVSPTALDDAALLALAADAWKADVPTAKSLAQGQAYVYYYVRGNDSDTDEENFSDGDILAANALTVTIAAEPTYAVTFAEGTQDADKWTVKAGTDGSFQSLPLEGVKAGTKVKLKYDGALSMLKGVKATSDAKPAATVKTITIAADFHTSGQIATAPEITIEYNEGEKWSDVAARYDWLKMYETYTVYYDADSKSGDLHTADGGVKPSDLVDPNKSYYWGYE